MNALIALFAVLSFGSPHAARAAQTPAAVQQAEPAVEPAMAMLGRMVGGTWRTTGAFVAEFTYEWRVKGKAIRGIGAIAKGTKQEFPSEELYGWDDTAKKVYYMDFHGSSTVYKGWAEARDGKFAGDFEGLIGDKGHYRFEAVLPDDDTMISTLIAQNAAGKWVPLHALTFKRIR